MAANEIILTGSLLPEASLERLRKGFGTKWRGLGPVEVQALVTADVEGRVTNARMQQLSEQHAAELTKVLQGLALRGLLRQVGQKRGTAYELPERVASVTSAVVNSGDSIHKGDSLHNAGGDSIHSLDDLPPEEQKKLKFLAAPAAVGMRLPTEETRRIILALCQGRFLTAAALAEIMNRNPVSLRTRFLAQMVTDGLLRRKYADEPNRPDQAYTTRKKVGGK